LCDVSTRSISRSTIQPSDKQNLVVDTVWPLSHVSYSPKFGEGARTACSGAGAILMYMELTRPPIRTGSSPL